MASPISYQISPVLALATGGLTILHPGPVFAAAQSAAAVDAAFTTGAAALLEGSIHDRAANPASPTPTGKAGAGSPDLFSVQSADGASRLRLRGYVQADARFFASSSGQTGPTTFVLRRVRPILEGTLYNKVDFRLMPDFGEGKAQVQDAYGEIRFSPAVRVRAGKYKPPLSIERLQSGADLLFVERSIANNLAPNRDVGVQVGGDLASGVLSYAVGLFNGVPDGGSSDADTGDDKDVVGRVFVQPFKNNARSPLKNLGLGIAASNGGRTESLSSLAFKTASRATFFKYDPTVVGAGTSERIDPQFSFYNGPFGLLGETISSRQQVLKPAVPAAGTTPAKPAAMGNLTFHGWVIQGSWVLTGEKASYQGVTPSHSFGLTPGKGAVELAARYSSVELGSEAFTKGLADPAASAATTRATTLGLNWYLAKGVKTQFNYEHTDFGQALKFGSNNRDHEDALLARLQVGF